MLFRSARTRPSHLLQRSSRGFISLSQRTGHVPTSLLGRDLLHVLHALAAPATHPRTPASRAELHQTIRSPRTLANRHTHTLPRCTDTPMHPTHAHTHALTLGPDAPSMSSARPYPHWTCPARRRGLFAYHTVILFGLTHFRSIHINTYKYVICPRTRETLPISRLRMSCMHITSIELPTLA